MAAQTKTQPRQQTQAPQQAPTGNLPAVINEFRRELALREKAYVPLLPQHIDWQKFQASVWAAVANNPDLVGDKVSRPSLFRACAEAAELGLSLNPALKEADILKVWNGRTKSYEAQFRPRFQGLMKLAKQSGEIKSINAHEVYKWDRFEYEHGLHEKLIHKPGPKPMNYDQQDYWGITHAYCVWEEVDGTKKFEVMELADLVRIMNRTSSKKQEQDGSFSVVGPWVTDFPPMCRKTVVRAASKYMPLSAEKMKPFMNAVDLDNKREAGEEVALQDGDVIDVTDGDVIDAEEGQPQQQESAKQQQQVDDLESRMQAGTRKEPPKPQPQPAQQAKAPTQKPAPAQEQAQPQETQRAKPQVVRMEAPRTNGRTDLSAWAALAAAELRPLTGPQRAAWRIIHEDLIQACEMTCPDQLDEVIKLLP